jgi:hypothetical protein
LDALAILQKLGTSQFIEDLGATLEKVSEEVKTSRRKAKVTVTFNLAPAPDPDGVVILEEIKRSPPASDSRGAYFFSVDGELHDRDPRQPTMEFHTVDKATGEVITVAADTKEIREA